MVQITAGLVTFAYFEGCNLVKSGLIKKFDQILPYVVMVLFNGIPVVRGLFLSIIFAAALRYLWLYFSFTVQSKGPKTSPSFALAILLMKFGESKIIPFDFIASVFGGCSGSLVLANPTLLKDLLVYTSSHYCLFPLTSSTRTLTEQLTLRKH
ncbi:hypothetical protein AHF37_01272 [Paragonimus kellicotti]|nr:hypothetical protein AHF37_01272 [Paragonimus kellicotti]